MQVLTVSTDHPEEIRKGRRVHGLQAIMLSDRTLAVTDAFGPLGAWGQCPYSDLEPKRRLKCLSPLVNAYGEPIK